MNTTRPAWLRSRRWRGFPTVGIVAVLVLTACAGDPGVDVNEAGDHNPWGPLAVVPPPEGRTFSAHGGKVEITADCVLLTGDDFKMVMVWPADRTRWHEDDAQIEFRGDDARRVVIGDGDQVRVGGSAAAHGRISAWVAPPSLACGTHLAWFVGAVERVG